MNEKGRFIGFNTDGKGFIRGLKEHGVDIKDKNVVILGSGGAGTAIAIQAALDGAKQLSIFNRKDEFYTRALENAKIINEEMENSRCLAKVFDIAEVKLLREEIEKADILVNSSGVGMHPIGDQCLIPDSSYLRPDLVVADTVYYPVETKLLKMAQSAGCKTVNGLAMMLWQGAEAFKLWTGQEMPVEIIKEQLFSGGVEME